MKRPALLLLFFVSLEVNGATGWSHKAINIDHNYTRGENVLVGVLDTAVRCTHTELARRCQEWVPIGYEDGYYGDHGTHIASLIAGSPTPSDWRIIDDSLRTEPYGLILRKGDPEFKALVDKTLAAMMKSGEFQELYAKWFTRPIPPKNVNLNFPMTAPLKDAVANPNDKGV